MDDNWILRPRPAPQAKLRLFCLHPAGRGASVYFPWLNLLPAGIELCCVQLPGRESRIREKPFTRMAPIISALDENLFPLLDRPFAIFGASMGALIGFELTRMLYRAYRVLPVHLFLASRQAPQGPDRLPPISHLDDALFLEEVQKRYNGIPRVIREDRELLDLFLPVLRADFNVIETYVYEAGEPLDCPLVVLRGSADQVVLPEDLLGWETHTRQRFTQQAFPGGHFFFYDQPIQVVEYVRKNLGNKAGFF